MNTEEKQQLKVWISSSCIERLRRHITRKYPNFKKGWLSIEVENFINQGIAAFKRQTADEKHTHTLPERDDILLLKGRLIEHFGLENEEHYDNVKFTKREFLNAIKVVERITDDRPAKARLNLLLSRKLCVELNQGKGTTQLMKFKSAYENVEAKAKSQEELKKNNEADAVVAKWLD